MARGFPLLLLSPPLLLLPLALVAVPSAEVLDDLRQPAEVCTLTDTLSLMWSTIGRIVRTAVEPAVAALDGRLDGLQAQLSGDRSQLEGRLDQVGDRLEAQILSMETKVEARVGSCREDQEAQTSAMTNRLTQLESALTGVQSQIEARLKEAQSQQETQALAIAERLSQFEHSLSGIQSTRKLDSALKQTQFVRDCSDLPADAQSGIYVLQPGLGQPVPALCDQDTDGGGWTVFQRRADVLPRQDFFLGWEAYKWGFGALDGEFWWGLQNLWLVTAQLDRRYQVRVDLEDFEGDRRHAVYDGFSVASERDGYRLTVANYTGTAGDSLLPHSGLKFSTKDQDQDTFERGSCALNHKGGWWYGLVMSFSKKCLTDTDRNKNLGKISDRIPTDNIPSQNVTEI